MAAGARSKAKRCPCSTQPSRIAGGEFAAEAGGRTEKKKSSSTPKLVLNATEHLYLWLSKQQVAGFAPPAGTNADTKISQRRNFQAERLRLDKLRKNPAPERFLSSFEGSGHQVASKFVDLLTYPKSVLKAA